MTSQQLTALNNVLTYLGDKRLSLIVANNVTGKWDWKFADPHIGDIWVAYSGTLTECRQLQTAYENPPSPPF